MNDIGKYLKEKKRKKYSKSYNEYWTSKGEYGQRRIISMIYRKAKRFAKRQWSMKMNHAQWLENGEWRQECEMGGSCIFPCNGDC